MAFDKDVPAGNTKISIGDNGIRANNTALEDAIDLEHDFTTGGTQTGRHHFPVDSEANLALLSPAGVSGGLAIATGVRSDGVLVYNNGSAWVRADCGATDLPRLDEVNEYTAPSHSVWTSVTPGGGSVAIDLDDGPTFYATISGDVTVANPTNVVSGYCLNFLIQLTWSGAGHTVSWGSNYRASSGVAPIYTTGDGDVNLFACTVLPAGLVLVSGIVDIGTF